MEGKMGVESKMSVSIPVLHNNQCWVTHLSDKLCLVFLSAR